MAGSKTKVPEQIRAAVDGLLSPYGINLAALEGVGSDQKARYLSVADVDATYGIKRWSLYRLIKAGKVSAVKTAAARSGKVLVETTSIEKYFNTLTTRGAI